MNGLFCFAEIGNVTDARRRFQKCCFSCTTRREPLHKVVFALLLRVLYPQLKFDISLVFAAIQLLHGAKYSSLFGKIVLRKARESWKSINFHLDSERDKKDWRLSQSFHRVRAEYLLSKKPETIDNLSSRYAKENPRLLYTKVIVIASKYYTHQ